jgi:3-mercaptopyruvate sulfurtransferase SseA
MRSPLPRVRGTLLATLLIATAILWAAPAPADDPEVPEKYISVDEAKALVDKRQRVLFVDVREKAQYDDLHIKGAINIPLDQLRTRLRDIPRNDLVVLY